MRWRWPTVVLAGMLIAFIGTSLVIWIFGGSETDPVCRLAEEKGMHCVILGSPSIYERGALILPPTGKNANETLPLPDEHLFSKSCLLPGADVGFSEFHDDSSPAIAFPNQTTTINRSFAAMLKLNSSKKIGGLEVKAGPEANSSLVLTLKSNGARFFSIEPTSLRDALGSCLIRRSCVARVKSGSDRLVKQLLVAKDLSLIVREKGGESFPLNFAVGKKLVEVKLGTGSKQKQTTDLPSRGDMAFGARLFDPQEFADVQPCGKDLVSIKASGTTTSTALVQSRDNKADERRAAVTDKDELAQVSLDLSDRKYNEGMIPANATSSGKPIIDKATGQVDFHYLMHTEAGQRWVSIGPNGVLLDPKYKPVFADSYAQVSSAVELELANRSDDAHHLMMHVQAKENTSISRLQLPGMHSDYSDYLKPFTMKRQDGKETNLDAVWKRGEDDKEFDLGPLAPGEAITLKMGYTREDTSSSSLDPGSIAGDVKLDFRLQ
jgi:hypothetical protein